MDVETTLCASWVNLTLQYFNLGPPRGFCKGKSNGGYASPDEDSKFFFCFDGTSTGCQSCGFGVYKAECARCLPRGQSKLNSTRINYSEII